MSDGRRLTAYYSAAVDEFCSMPVSLIVGELTRASQHDLDLAQGHAWSDEIRILQETLSGLVGRLFLEFKVPRVGSRIDAVVLSGAAIIPIEFKVGASRYERADYNQSWDYALDLKNFHLASHDAPIFPILVATQAANSDDRWKAPAPDGVYPPFRANTTTLRDAIEKAIALCPQGTLNPIAWLTSPYQPTPTIVQAAQALYARHAVEEISRSEAGATNLAVTSRRIDTLIAKARALGEKILVFVTGVPGAGKTLVGLNIATQRPQRDGETIAAYLSGNVPLVRVLTESLTIDEVRRQRTAGTTVRVGDIRQKVKAFIQNVHHFRDAGLENTSAPADHVVVFDEAQRAWDRAQTAAFMRRRRSVPDFQMSEPEFLLAYMDRRQDWAAVICLIGQDQEIHTGEAGTMEWLRAIQANHSEWIVFYPGELAASDQDIRLLVEALQATHDLRSEPDLHLSTSVRSFRAEQTSEFVRSVLALEMDGAAALLQSLLQRFPIRVTRSLDRAKEWVRGQARGSERYGLLASSSAQRLRPHAIDVRVEVNETHWFLKGASDPRSSYFLEEAATEFKVQGLELDWACVTWDADLRYSNGAWGYFDFRGGNWVRVRVERRQRYLVNSYRVLLTRARQGMVVFVPKGETRDRTRSPAFYDGTYQYLRDLGVPELG